MSDPRLTPLAAALPADTPFVGIDTLERQRGAPFAARLGANENGFGPSPAAIDAMRGAAGDMWMYGDGESHALRHALGDRHGIDPAHIVVGEGIDGLLGTLVRLTVAPGDAVVTSLGAYPTFNYHVTGFGGLLHKVPYRGDHEDPGALLACARETGAKLIYLSNPDNPMGSWHPAARIEEMIAAVPPGCLLVLDEAYADCAPPGAIPRMDPGAGEVIRMRTFSKAYGLAGLRIGYAIGPRPLISAFDRVRNHFGVNRMAQGAAGAALADDAWLAQVLGRIESSRAEIARITAACGLTSLPSAANFVAVDCGRDGDHARRVLAELAARDVFVRMPGAAPLDRCIRISCGPEEDMARLAKALPGALEAASR
ncbi:pyridoxal phosphate-dependent aminotransferase [Profundibacterium mesophilum]|uniref:Histidinol-phosphate aminotransferase n=1 Tax=Profundibacterium mesophilum KAUST100406-0324 TaxID=1037889 RepID=A0A921NWR6_9RHOB|nr:pyridoxal phosphate-dependent aminotransferase [Profundibacterium mesophilum]KAF0676766.1 Histidinol-phosphate aminotransferase [Profundibacterium mesophilum KAUST100406-0324]